MSRSAQVLVLAGSNRSASLNRKLAANAVSAVQTLGLAATALDLRQHPLPVYDGDLESEVRLQGELAVLREYFLTHPVWLIASPDYNSSVSPLLKNVIDWVSRPVANQHFTTCFKERIVGLMASSPGSSGGARGLPHLRQILVHLGARVHERTFLVPRGHEAFDEHDRLRERTQQDELRAFVATLATPLLDKNRSVA